MAQWLRLSVSTAGDSGSIPGSGNVCIWPKKKKKGKEDIISVSRNSGKNRTECIHDDK